MLQEPDLTLEKAIQAGQSVKEMRRETELMTKIPETENIDHVQKCGRNHRHHVVLSAQIFLTLSCHPSLSSIAPGRSSGLHPVSSHTYLPTPPLRQDMTQGQFFFLKQSLTGLNSEFSFS